MQGHLLALAIRHHCQRTAQFAGQAAPFRRTTQLLQQLCGGGFDGWPEQSGWWLARRSRSLGRERD